MVTMLPKENVPQIARSIHLGGVNFLADQTDKSAINKGYHH